MKSSVDSPNDGEESGPGWKRFAVRLVLRYVAVYCVDLLGDVISFTLHLLSAPLKLQFPLPALVWVHVVPWVAQHVLHLGTVKPSIWGSGDTLYDWVQLLCEAVLAFVLALGLELRGSRPTAFPQRSPLVARGG